MRQKLGEMLIEAGAIDQAQLRSALADQRKWGRPLGKTLVEMRFISEETMVEVLARQLGLSAVNLEAVQIDRAAVELVPVYLAKQHAVFAFGLGGRFLDLAMADPTNLGIVDEIRIRAQLNVRPYLAGPRMIERAIERYYGGGAKAGRTRSDFEIPLDGPAPQMVIEREPSGPVPEVRDGLRTFRPSQPPPQQQRVQHPSQAPLDIAIRTPAAGPSRDREIDALQERISTLEAQVQRDEGVLRGLLSLLIEKGIATRDEIIERLG